MENTNLVSLESGIDTALVGTSKAIQDAVVKVLSDKLVQDRTSIILTALDKKKEVIGEIKKIRPVKTYSEDGKTETKTYSEDQHKSIRSLKERRESLEKAIETALGENTVDAYNKLKGKIK